MATNMGYQYETSPRKLKPDYEPQRTVKKNKAKNKNTNQSKRKKENSKNRHTKLVMYVLVGFSILFAISYRNSLITKSFNEKEELKQELGVLQKENVQLKINIQNSLNLSNIEQLASSKLGMKKVDGSQKEYISLPKKDYVEPASEQVTVTQEKNWFQKLIDKIANII